MSIDATVDPSTNVAASNITATQPDDNACKDLTQEQWSEVLQALLNKSVGERVGRGVFQEIANQFNCSRSTICHLWRYEQ